MALIKGKIRLIFIPIVNQIYNIEKIIFRNILGGKFKNSFIKLPINNITIPICSNNFNKCNRFALYIILNLFY